MNKGKWYKKSSKEWLNKITKCEVGKSYKFWCDNDVIIVRNIIKQNPKWKDEQHSDLSYAIITIDFVNKNLKQQTTMIEHFWNGSWICID